MENTRIREGVAPTRIRCRCTEDEPTLHPCELCLHPYECPALLQPPVELSQKRFCVFCYRTACQLLEQKKKKITSPALLHRIKAIVRDDFTQIYSTPGYHAHRELLKSRVTGIWDNLQGQALEEDDIIYAWKDSYVADICGDSAQGEWSNVIPVQVNFASCAQRPMLTVVQRMSAVSGRCGSATLSAHLPPALMAFSRSPWMRMATSGTTSPAI